MFLYCFMLVALYEKQRTQSTSSAQHSWTYWWSGCTTGFQITHILTKLWRSLTWLEAFYSWFCGQVHNPRPFHHCCLQLKSQIQNYCPSQSQTQSQRNGNFSSFWNCLMSPIHHCWKTPKTRMKGCERRIEWFSQQERKDLLETNLIRSTFGSWPLLLLLKLLFPEHSRPLHC